MLTRNVQIYFILKCPLLKATQLIARISHNKENETVRVLGGWVVGVLYKLLSVISY